MGRFPELVVLSCLAVAEAGAAPRSAADCDALVRAEPRALASYRCYWDLARTGRRMEAERALEAILRREPENPDALHGKPGVTAPIVGATQLRHLEDAVAATGVRLTGDEVRALEAPYRPHPVLGHS